MFAAAARSSMLDLEFAELTDVGRVRDHNEDYSGHASYPLRNTTAARTAGSLPWPMEWAAKNAARWLRRPQSKR